jgi:hypothetical protein
MEDLSLFDKNLLNLWRNLWLSICVFVYLFICLSVCLSICVCLSVCLSICVFVYLCVCLSVCLSFCVFVYLCVCLSVCLFFCVFVNLQVLCLSICLFVFLYCCLSVCLSFCGFVNLQALCLFFKKSAYSTHCQTTTTLITFSPIHREKFPQKKMLTRSFVNVWKIPRPIPLFFYKCGSHVKIHLIPLSFGETFHSQKAKKQR